MIEHELVRELAEKSSSKIVMVVADGLGGLPLDPGGKTELETAVTPHLDSLVRRGTSGSSRIRFNPTSTAMKDRPLIVKHQAGPKNA